MRMEEAFNKVSDLKERGKQGASKPIFTDVQSDDFAPIKSMLKDLEKM